MMQENIQRFQTAIAINSIMMLVAHFWKLIRQDANHRWLSDLCVQSYIWRWWWKERRPIYEFDDEDDWSSSWDDDVVYDDNDDCDDDDHNDGDDDDDDDEKEENVNNGGANYDADEEDEDDDDHDDGDDDGDDDDGNHECRWDPNRSLLDWQITPDARYSELCTVVHWSSALQCFFHCNVSSEMEKRADASVLFFLLDCANVLAVYAQIR